MSFDPHPIDRLALSCLFAEGVALLKLPSPSPSFHCCWRTGISTKHSSKNLPHTNLTTLSLAEQGNPALSSLTKWGLAWKPFCNRLGTPTVVGRGKNLYV